ncbi:hypothetical protein FYJ43_07670 [Cutibacterium sp. WCA-380-WT-3A]|uniref:Phage tail protein n=1 Tax=Cutibacterium porci TaxID=2605781 RepID=A0A7K0J7H8_9ACTN|nr:hypothetical protein [Cutibacterium porci]MSS45916.1 hypothetical protein [Cutibacterium porci]
MSEITWPNDIALEVFIQDPSSKAFRLDLSPLGSAPLQEMSGTEMILDEGHLDAGTLGVAEPPAEWWSITEECTSISSVMGARPDLISPTAETGTLEATLRDMPGLLSIGIGPGTPIRLRYDQTPLWAGWIDDVTVTWNKEGGSTSTITATDWVSHAQRIKRYGRQIDTEPAIDRFTHLIWESLDVDLPTMWIHNLTNLTSARRKCCAVLDEASLSDHLTWSATTGGFLWCPRPDLDVASATIREIRNPNQAVSSAWSDVSEPSFLDADVTAGTSQIVNELELSQHFISRDDGQQSVGTTTSTWRDAASISNWGIRPATTNVSVSDTADLPAVAADIMARSTAKGETVSSITVKGTDWIATETPPQPLDATAAVIRGRVHHLIVATVAHSLTPITWTTTLTTIRSVP